MILKEVSDFTVRESLIATDLFKSPNEYGFTEGFLLKYELPTFQTTLIAE